MNPKNELIRELNQILSENHLPMRLSEEKKKLVPAEWIGEKPKTIYNIIVKYEHGVVATSVSDKCKIHKLSDNKWLYGFEDTGWFGPLISQPFDWDEPILEVERIKDREEKAKFTIREWDGSITGDIYWGDKIIFSRKELPDPAFLGNSVGMTKTIAVSEVTDPFISSVPSELSWWDKFIKNFWEPQPWYVKAGIAVGVAGGITFGTIYLIKALMQKTFEMKLPKKEEKGKGKI